MQMRIFIFFLFVLLSGSLKAQFDYSMYDWDTAKYYRVKAKGYKEYKGYYVSKTSKEVILYTRSGKKPVPFDQIKEVEEIVPPTNTVYFGDTTSTGENVPKPRDIPWEMGVHQTRYLFAPSAIMLKKGTGYYQNTWVTLNSVNYGLSDHVSVGGGLELVSLLALPLNGQPPAFFITPKVGFQAGKNTYLAGGLYGVVFPTVGGAAIPYAVATYGNSEYNGSIGAGLGMATGGYVTPSPIFTACGMARIAPNIALVTENWFVPDNESRYTAVNSFGFRVYRQMTAIDVAAVIVPRYVPFPLPFLSFTLKF